MIDPSRVNDPLRLLQRWNVSSGFSIDDDVVCSLDVDNLTSEILIYQTL